LKFTVEPLGGGVNERRQGVSGGEAEPEGMVSNYWDFSPKSPKNDSKVRRRKEVEGGEFLLSPGTESKLRRGFSSVPKRGGNGRAALRDYVKGIFSNAVKRRRPLNDSSGSGIHVFGRGSVEAVHHKPKTRKRCPRSARIVRERKAERSEKPLD